MFSALSRNIVLLGAFMYPDTWAIKRLWQVGVTTSRCDSLACKRPIN